jgi:hypothetical protein
MARLSATRTLIGTVAGNSVLARSAIETARRVGDKGALAYVLNNTPWATWRPDRLEKEHPALALHLNNSNRTGMFCSYAPERPVGWQL